MNRKILTLLFISFISVCLVIGMYGRVAIAEEDPDREGKAVERESQCFWWGCIDTVHQYTSEYDLAMGNVFPELYMSSMRPNTNPFTSSYEYDFSAIGGVTQPMFRFPTNPMSSMFAQMGAPRMSIGQYQNPFMGNASYTNIFQGFGGGTSGAFLGPFSSNLWGGGGYQGASAYGNYGTGFGSGWGSGYGTPFGFGSPWGSSWGGGFGFPGQYQQRIY